MITQEELQQLLHYDPDTGFFTWNVKKNPVKPGDKAGSYDLYGYLTVRINYKSYKCHRLAWLYVYGEFPQGYIDHINRIKDDNRIENLRCVRAQQNSFNCNTRVDNTSGHVGVSFCKSRNKYEAYIGVGGKKKNLGRFTSIDLAIAAYKQAKAALHVI